MKKVLVFIMFMAAMMSLTSCGSYANISNEQAYKNGYNMGVFLRGGSSDEYLR